MTNRELRRLDPTDCGALLAPLHAELISLLRGLSNADWQRPTVAGSWRVRDVVAHLLDIDVRRLSFHRDSRALPVPQELPPQSYAEQVDFLNALNREWVRIAERMSERVLVDLIEVTGPQVAGFLASLPPHERAYWPVAWAGETESENWMDVGRDYTERWHHQAQLRDAVGAPPLNERRWLHPVLELSVRALPHAFREIAAADGDAFVVDIGGEAGGVWSLLREGGRWNLRAGDAPSAVARAQLDADTAWRLFYNALSRDPRAPAMQVDGDPRFAEAFARVRSVMV
jgi:hypothetical protein